MFDAATSTLQRAGPSAHARSSGSSVSRQHAPA